MKKVLSLAITALIAFTANAQFEGTIEFKKKTITDTTEYVYYVKGPKIRLDEIGSKSKKVEGSFFINTQTNILQALDYERKLYLDQPTGTPNKPGSKCEITTTKNSKVIGGMKCTEYVVKNKDENTTISFWLTKGKFDFFDVMLRVLNRKDKFSTYYLEIPGTKGMMPMLAIQSSLDGKENARLETTAVNKKVLDAKATEIPAGYKKFEK